MRIHTMILALDTSQSSGSIALEQGGRLVYSAYFDINITHSETLMPQLDHALRFCASSPKDIEAIVLCIGPGSFTGIRIGLATAKGIAYGLQIPLYTYDSLAMIAVSAYQGGRKIVSVVDAKMKELYSATYDQDLQELCAPKLCTPQEVVQDFPPDAVLIGSGAALISSFLDQKNVPYQLALAHQNLPSAISLLSLMQLKAQKDVYSFSHISEMEPLYLRESTAQIRNRQKLET